MKSPYKKIAFTVYPVKDMGLSREFYEKVLGLEPGDNFESGWQEYDFGGTTFAVSSMITEFVKPGTQGSVSFEVDDLKTLVGRLQEKGVKFTMDEIMETPVCWMSFILDPDGNTVGLHQAKE